MRLLQTNRWHRIVSGINVRSIISQKFCTVESNEWQKPDSNGSLDTGITVYNCVRRGNVPLIIRNPHCLTWYTCGPTVYDDAHIGHAVCYMKCDIIQRILRNHFHLNVITAMNITNIDNKIMERSAVKKVCVEELARRYEESFWQDIDALGIQRADIILRVTECIPQIIAFIEHLLAKNEAYVAADGSVYFANARKNGKLQNLESSLVDNRTKLQSQSISVRRSPRDFALWKAAKADEQPQWAVPWKYETDRNVSTAGRPGWHTECAAMATELFGNSVDVHAGGIDLKFPHHENEEAQCCSFHNRTQWVNYWFHIGHLVTTDNVKMSKSLKNTISIKEFLKHYSSDQLRMACLMSTYHTHIAFGDDVLLNVGNILKRFVSFFDDTERLLKNSAQHHCISNRHEIAIKIQTTVDTIDASLKNDFDTKSCILSLLDLITLVNKSIQPMHLKQSNVENALQSVDMGNGLDVIKSAQNVVRQFFEMVGFHDIVATAFARQTKRIDDSGDSFPIETFINDIMLCRTQMLNDAKANKDKHLFEICDQLRSIFRKNGLTVKDHGNSSSWQFDNVVTRKNQSNK